jgi:hypothetical protein
MAQHLADKLEQAIAAELPALRAISEDQAERPRREGGWSPKQELGHLIDSATNNHARFVRGALEPDFHGLGYDQEGWVKLHGYAALRWDALVDFWQRYNALLAHLVRQIPEERLGAVCRVGDSAPVTLGFLIEDYMLHMQHHLDQIQGRARPRQYPGAALGV